MAECLASASRHTVAALRSGHGRQFGCLFAAPPPSANLVQERSASTASARLRRADCRSECLLEVKLACGSTEADGREAAIRRGATHRCGGLGLRCAVHWARALRLALKISKTDLLFQFGGNGHFSAVSMRERSTVHEGEAL
jgi:hypothetical protein